MAEPEGGDGASAKTWAGPAQVAEKEGDFPGARRPCHGVQNRVPHDMINIAPRPAEADDRAVPAHYGEDLTAGEANASVIGTLVERTTGYTMLGHLPDGYRAGWGGSAPGVAQAGDRVTKWRLSPAASEKSSGSPSATSSRNTSWCQASSRRLSM